MLGAAPKIKRPHEGVVCILTFGILTVEEPPAVLSSLVLLYYLGEIAVDDHTFRPKLMLKRECLGSLDIHALEQVSNEARPLKGQQNGRDDRMEASRGRLGSRRGMAAASLAPFPSPGKVLIQGEPSVSTP